MWPHHDITITTTKLLQKSTRKQQQSSNSSLHVAKISHRRHHFHSMICCHRTTTSTKNLREAFKILLFKTLISAAEVSLRWSTKRRAHYRWYRNYHVDRIFGLLVACSARLRLNEWDSFVQYEPAVSTEYQAAEFCRKHWHHTLWAGTNSPRSFFLPNNDRLSDLVHVYRPLQLCHKSLPTWVQARQHHGFWEHLFRDQMAPFSVFL